MPVYPDRASVSNEPTTSKKHEALAKAIARMDYVVGHLTQLHDDIAWHENSRKGVEPIQAQEPPCLSELLSSGSEELNAKIDQALSIVDEIRGCLF